jgi:hypothetical protein
MLDIRKLQSINANAAQLESVKQLYYDLDLNFELSLFAKTDHIRVYVGDFGWFSITKAGRIVSHLAVFYINKVMNKLSPKSLSLISADTNKRIIKNAS